MPSRKSPRVPSGHGAAAAWFVLALFAIVVLMVLIGRYAMNMKDGLPTDFLLLIGVVGLAALCYLFGLPQAVSTLAEGLGNRLGRSKKD